MKGWQGKCCQQCTMTTEQPVGTSGAGAAAGVGAEANTVGPGGSPAGGATGAAGGTGAGVATGAGAVPAVSGVAARPRPYFVPLLQQVLGLPSSTGPPPLECPQPVPSQLQLQPASPLPSPSPYTGPTGGLAERCEPVSPVRATRTSGRGSQQRPPPVPGTHRMSLRPSTAPMRAPLPSPPTSPLPTLADPESDSLRAGDHAHRACPLCPSVASRSGGSGSVSWRATRSSSVLGSSCEAEIYAGAMAAQELRWLTYLLTDFGEVPRSPPVLYVDNKAMLALCREQRLEHRTKHIALRYFLARELQ
ncbi:unnamed protein product [Closterium sp. NIES-54]